MEIILAQPVSTQEKSKDIYNQDFHHIQYGINECGNS